MTTPPRKSATKPRGRPFGPGNAGKPKGTRHRATLAVQVLLEGDATKLARKAVDLALEGDTVALRLCLERIAPVRRGQPLVFNLPPVETAADVVTAIGAVIAQVSAGELTTEEGAAMAALLEAKRRSIETVEIETRLAALEEKQL